MSEYENVKMTESEMIDAFNALRKKMFLSKLAIIVGFIGISAFFLMNKIIFAVAMIVVFIGGAMKYGSYNKEIKDIAGNGILKKIFYELLDEMEFDHNGHYEKAEIEEAKFLYPYHTIKGTDLVKGKYKGKDISLCDLELVGTTHTRGSSHDSTVFHGLWVIYDLGKNFNANLSILEMNAIEKKISEKGFETDNAEFNKKYTSMADDVVEAKKILTDRLMNMILEFDKAANAKSNVAFLRNGKIHVALNNNSMDPLAVKASDPEVLKTQYMAKIKVITDFIDELNSMLDKKNDIKQEELKDVNGGIVLVFETNNGTNSDGDMATNRFPYND